MPRPPVLVPTECTGGIDGQRGEGKEVDVRGVLQCRFQRLCSDLEARVEVTFEELVELFPDRAQWFDRGIIAEHTLTSSKARASSRVLIEECDLAPPAMTFSVLPPADSRMEVKPCRIRTSFRQMVEPSMETVFSSNGIEEEAERAEISEPQFTDDQSANASVKEPTVSTAAETSATSDSATANTPLSPLSHKLRKVGSTFQASCSGAMNMWPSNTKAKLEESPPEDHHDARVHWRRMIRKNHARRAHLEPLTQRTKQRAKENMTPFQLFVKGALFENISMVLVLSNTITMGAQVQYSAVHQEILEGHGALEIVFGICFTLELVCRAAAERSLFVRGNDWTWNLFDSTIVLTMWVEVVLDEMASQDSGLLRQVSMLRVLRMLRVIRVIRIIRVLKFFRQLRIMMQGIVGSLTSLIWTMVILLMMFYIFGIILTQGVTDYCFSNDAWMDPETAGLRKSFGRLDRSILSLYEAMAGGISWGELVDDLTPLSRLYRATFLVFISIAFFAVLNIVTGVFVENALAGAQQDKEAVIQESLRQKESYVDSIHRVFNEIDVDGSGYVSLSEFRRAIEDVRMVAYFDGIGLDITDVKALFVLLDRDQAGSIDVEEFLIGCLRLKGEAKAIDIAKLLYESEWVVHGVEVLIQGIRNISAHLQIHDDVRLSSHQARLLHSESSWSVGSLPTEYKPHSGRSATMLTS